ncbi:hypothetical protein K502DRAFT_242123 [Neoconidiobolus thromboides FSU 785]|nr:hypothetical protein K502DRAFT_242123 [Neoconidiobolus thromboides FSU 785]
MRSMLFNLNSTKPTLLLIFSFDFDFIFNFIILSFYLNCIGIYIELNIINQGWNAFWLK